MGLLSRSNLQIRNFASFKSLFAGKPTQVLTIGDRLEAARDCDMVELDRNEVTTENISVEAGRQYNIFLKVVSTSTRRDAAMLTFLIDVALTPDEAVKHFPRFTTAVGRPFVFIPNQSEEQNGGLTSVQFTVPPGARVLTIGARRWARDGNVQIGKCLVMEREGAKAVRATDRRLPGSRFCELVIDAGNASHLTTVAVFTTTLTFRDAQHRLLAEGGQVFSCAAYPGTPQAAAALPLPFEVPTGAVTIGISIASDDEQLPGLVQITPQALAQPVEAAGFVSSLKDRLDQRAAAIRTFTGKAAASSKDAVDDWLCSEKAGALQRAANLFGPDRNAETSSSVSTSFPVVSGTIVEIRLVPVLVPHLPEPRTVTFKSSFHDADGRELPHAGHQLSWSNWTRRQYPLAFETDAFDQQAHFAVPHYIVVPPYAVSLNVEAHGAAGNDPVPIQVQTVTVFDSEVASFLERCMAYIGQRAQFLARLACCLPATLEAAILSAMADEHKDCGNHLELLKGFLLSRPDMRVWQKAIATTSFDIPGLPRLLPEPALDEDAPAAKTSQLHVGVIGSRDFIYYLSVWHQVTPLTADVVSTAAEVLSFDLVVLQQSDRLAGDWPQSFFGFVDGSIPASTLETIRVMRRRGIPIVLVADPSPVFLRLLESWAAEVDWLAISGPGAEDEEVAARLGKRSNFVRFPLLVETRLHRPVVEERRPAFSILYSSISDLFDFRDNIEYLERIADAGLVIADRYWRLVIERTRSNLQAPALAERVFGSASTEQWAVLCRHAAVALFFEASLLPCYKTAQAIAEAIANGAVVVYVGDPLQLGEMADSVIAAHTPYQLSLVLRELRFDWYRQQVWLRAFRHLHRHCRFERFAHWLDRPALAEAPLEPTFPKATMITISKRPHLRDYCIEKFRCQTHPDVELVLILNTDVDEMALLDNTNDPRIRIYHVPKEFNIGYCLNMAIAGANGAIWLKCDDDDFYGPHYVEDMLNAFHFSGAAVVGKPQWYVYFEDEDAIYFRMVATDRERSVLRPGEFLTGATLAAQAAATGRDNLWFSSTIRMANDSEWVRAAQEKGMAIFFSDRSNFVVFRSADLGNHTWSMSNDALRRQSGRLVTGSRYDLIC